MTLKEAAPIVDNFSRYPIDILYARVDTTGMGTTKDMDRAKCKSCKTMTRLPEGSRIDWMQVVPRVRNIETGEFLKHSCGNYLRGERIVGKFSDKQECGEKCISATGPACECRCRGENHGGKAA